jgi:phenylpropionate dioxygenase-like ring-hydroxylating dioxygenase large terminal subunit
VTEWEAVAQSAAVAPGMVVDANHVDELVVWRTADGVPCVMDARCPHQWSHLAAEGAVDGDAIICTSHWWRFGTDGAGAMLRTDGQSEERAAIRVRPCEEREGSIWIRRDPNGGQADTQPD